MIMNMSCLSESKPGFKAQDVEDSFDGNICRCTGYRPIMDAFKSLAVDASEELKRKCGGETGACPCNEEKKSEMKIEVGEEVDEYFEVPSSIPSPLYIKLKTGEEWVKPTSLPELFEAVQRFTSSGMKYRLVAGNTGTGVYKNDGPYQAFIEVNYVPELKQSSIAPSGVILGANVTLSMGIELLEKAAELDGYSYTGQMAKHLKRVANTPVRNAATFAGNLMIKHAHREFPSDVFLLLETVAAKLKIGTSPEMARDYSPLEFRNVDMTGKVILSIFLPPYKTKDYFFRSFKVTRRHQNSHAYVNAAVLFKVDPKRNFSVRDKPTICFGGINPEFVHAFGTELYFLGKFLKAGTLKGAMDSLEREIIPNHVLPDASPEFRRSLTQSLLYKVILGIYGDVASMSLRSGSGDIERGLHYGKQTYETDQSQWPLYQPIAKLEAFPQTSGEAEYINDIHPQMGELFGAFVLSTVGNAILKSIDASEALMTPGVVAFIQAKDIPGLNNYTIFYPEPEEIFASKKIHHAGQALGVVVAENRDTAFAAVKKISVSYDDIQPPILDIHDGIKEAEKRGKKDDLIVKICKSSHPTDKEKVTKNIQGEFRSGGQYHFHMEPQTAICIPTEDGMDVYSATQFVDCTQSVVAMCLGTTTNSVNVTVRRLGGAFGAKISRSSQVAAACAVAAHVTSKPVRIVLDLETNMRLIGKRLPYLCKYDLGVDDEGRIENLKAELFCDPGFAGNEATSLFALLCMQSCYRGLGWTIIPGNVKTNTASNTFCRAPGSTQAIAFVETIMEHIAWAVDKDPLEVRMTNLIQPGDPFLAIPGHKFEGENRLPGMIEDMKSSADYDARKKFVDTFNENNRWKKRGLAFVTMRYPQHYHDFKFPTYIAIFHVDGTVAVSHGGIEMGQGINTKVAQVVAHTLKIPLDKVKVKPTSSLISPNSGLTGAACTSELVAHSALKACEKLLEKIAPVQNEMKGEPWEKVIHACYMKGIQLSAHHQDNTNDILPYDIWGLTLTEVEIDVLTGEYKIVRVDLVEDAGKSLSPEVDIGQIEGAFMMGLGLWTTEKLVYDKNTGELLTNGTWEYKVPFPADVPEDFRVSTLKNSQNPFGVLASKATGEPPLTMSASVLFALRNAITAARKDVGNLEWFQMDGPVTPEDIHMWCLTSKEQFDL